MPEIRLIELVSLGLPRLANQRGKISKVLLCSSADDMRAALPHSDVLRKICFCEHLLLRILEFKFLALGSAQLASSVLVLTSSPFIKPFRFSKRSIWRRCEY